MKCVRPYKICLNKSILDVVDGRTLAGGLEANMLGQGCINCCCCPKSTQFDHVMFTSNSPALQFHILPYPGFGGKRRFYVKKCFDCHFKSI